MGIPLEITDVRPAREQPGFSEDVPFTDRRIDMVGQESYKGWGAHRGPILYAAYDPSVLHPDDPSVQMMRHNWRHPEGVYDHKCAACGCDRPRIRRGHDYEQLWYQAKHWFLDTMPRLRKKKMGYCSCRNGQSWAGKPDPGCPVHDMRST